MPYVLEILNNVNYEQVVSLVNEEATKDVLLLFGGRSVSLHTYFVFLRPYRSACK